MGPSAEAAVIELGEALANDESSEVRYYAVKSLDQFAEAAATAIDGLIKGLSDENPQTRYYSTKILGKCGVEATIALDQIKAMAEDPDPAVRKAAESAVRRLSKSLPAEQDAKP